MGNIHAMAAPADEPPSPRPQEPRLICTRQRGSARGVGPSTPDKRFAHAVAHRTASMALSTMQASVDPDDSMHGKKPTR